MIANIVEYDAVTEYPICSGWTPIKSAIFTAAKTGRGAVLYKVSTGSEPASYTFTLKGPPVQSLGSIVAFSGVNTTGGPFDATPADILVSSSGTATAVGATAITTASANAAVIMFGMGFGPSSASTWSGWTTTSPGTLAELYDNQAGSGNEKAVTIGAAWATQSTAGATGAGAATLSSGCRNGGILIALKAVGAATRLVITGSSSQTAGTSQNLTVTAVDAYGNTDTTYTGSKNLTFSGADSSVNPVTAPTVKNSSGTASAFGSTTAITFSSGVATVSGGNNGVMTLYKAETATISVTDGSISANGSDRLTVTVSATTASNLAFTTQPGGGSAGAVWSQQPVVAVQDQYGNTATTDSSTVTVAIQYNAGPGGTLSGTLTKAAVSGVADYSLNSLKLSIDKGGTGYTLRATDGSLTHVDSSGFNITGPTAAEVLIGAYAAAGGVIVEFQSIDEAGGNDMVLYLYRNGRWEEVGRQASTGEGDHTYRFAVPVLTAGDVCNLMVSDDEAQCHTINNVKVGNFSAQMVRMEKTGLTLQWESIPGRTYDIHRAEQLNGGWESIKAVEASSLQTVTFVPLDPTRPTGFFRIGIQE